MSAEITHTKGNPPIRLAGHINWAHERGSYPGCKAVEFIETQEDGSIAEQMNTYFELKEHAALVVDIRYTGNAAMVIYTKRLTDDEKAEMDEFNSHYAEWKEERKHAQLEAENKARAAVQAKLDADRKERELTRRQVEKLSKMAITHIRNCKKSPEDAKEAKAIIESFLADTAPREVVDETPDKTDLTDG
jgi:hypothetical protein